ncbi:MAG TPA: hypothetical protein VHF26_20725, partial [Trebonia sp.]|nr:hypothetical protein [Trebonia sp.]
MQPVLAPGGGLAQEPHRPQVDQVAVTGVGDRPQVHVVGGDLPAQQLHQRERLRVEAREHEYLAARPAQPGDARVEELGQRVRVPAGTKNVVAAARQAHQPDTVRSGAVRSGVGEQVYRGGNLLAND